MFFELLCRVQNSDALTKATELFRLISSDYFSNSSGATRFVYFPQNFLVKPLEYLVSRRIIYLQ